MATFASRLRRNNPRTLFGHATSTYRFAQSVRRSLNADISIRGVACECEVHTGLHISTENNYAEILCGSRHVTPGESGDLIVTNLNNLGMPFIRYSIGNTGS